MREDIHRLQAISDVRRPLEKKGIVSKRRHAAYQHGRSRSWLKIKNPDSPAMTRVWEELSDLSRAAG